MTYRVYIAQRKYGIVLDEINENVENTELKLVRLLAQWLSGSSERPRILDETENILSGNLKPDDETALVVGATLYIVAGSIDGALKVLHLGTDMHCNALKVQCYMLMHRYDLAGKTIRRMQTADEDALPSQLTTALFNLSKGGEQLQEALNIYEELKERYGPTPVLLNGQAAALIGMNRWEDADTILQEAIDLDNGNADTLVNMIMVSGHLGKPVEVINRLMSQLKDSDREHPFLVDYIAKEEEFNRCAQHYAPAVPS